VGLVAVLLPGVAPAQSDLTAVLWDSDARSRVLRQVVGSDWVFKTTAALETPAGPVVLAAVRHRTELFRIVRIERQKGAWVLAFESRFAAFTDHNFHRLSQGWQVSPPQSKQGDYEWVIQDADGDGRVEALLAGCNDAWCGGAFSFALFAPTEPGGWILHVELGNPVEFRLSTGPPPRRFRDYLLQRVLDAPLALEDRARIEPWFKRLP
jgi:hypothetical protein